MYAGIARSDNEREQALALAAASFSMPGATDKSAILRKSVLIEEHPGYSPDSAIVVSAPNGQVLGSAFLIECTVPVRNRIIRAVFVSSVSVAATARGRGMSRLLMNAAIESANAMGVDIAMLIARRAVDGFYTRFGFWGLSQYSKVMFTPATLPPVNPSNRPTSLAPVTVNDFEFVADLHGENYKNLVGHCLREPKMWRYILGKLPYTGMRFDLVRIEGDAVGYVIHDGQGNFHEVATIPGEAVCDPRTFFEVCSPGVEHVTLHIHPTHPFLKRLEGADISLTLRECRDGGHMVRILNPAAFPNQIIQHDKRNTWLSFSETARLFSVTRVTAFDTARDIGLFSSFNIPLMDQI